VASVRLTGIDKTFGDGPKVLTGVNLKIEDGEFVVFVGPSGCGKSTLLRIVAGLEEATGGDVYIGDELANDVPPAKRGTAMVFQSYALYPHMTVSQNMGFSLKLAGRPKEEIKAAVARAAEILQISHLLERTPRQLSGGQRQRVAIGRAIVRKPKVFLFDEPLSNLDAALRVQMRIELSKLHEELGSTMIYVTHDQVEAMTLGDRIVVLNGGIVEQVGSPLDLYDNPANLFVAGFLGSPKMNFLTVKTAGRAGNELVLTVGEAGQVAAHPRAPPRAPPPLQAGGGAARPGRPHRGAGRLHRGLLRALRHEADRRRQAPGPPAQRAQVRRPPGRSPHPRHEQPLRRTRQGHLLALGARVA